MLRTSPAPRHLKRRPNPAAGAITSPRLMAGVGVAVTVPTGAATVLAPAAEAAAPTAAPAATPKAAPKAAPSVIRTPAAQNIVWLSFGSEGELVKTLQQRLGGLVVDGSFGPATQSRLMSYQASKNLYVDGRVGPVTWAALGGFPGKAGEGKVCRVSTLRFGSTGELVRTAQQRLGGLSVDGSFGPATLARVRAYQASKSLPVTGTVDSATWRALDGFPCVGTGGPTTGTGATTTPGTTTTDTTGPVTPSVGDPSGPYRMPWAKGGTFKITQGPGGSWSHHTSYNRHGIDFGMPVGTPIVASRAGVVQDTGYTSMGGGMYVRIKDASGACQVYFHLSAYRVVAGQPIAQGQPIATSGNTGNSSGPHLHFGLIDCNTWRSHSLPNSVERGTNYTSGVFVTSTNG
ncbi:hypothetical protein EU513_14265 [Yimella sp. RIT 621]|uniref:peptidoglycan DD-metalloendopeptidase family protein n=1 Tax=Yimella sp. RIT 621 TaxID=2510323 RepID=UPI00101C22AA|nr:peptidoglycan DD-metalloendopeptidase family protein [Yimella sp. RIT 621]RYG76005.1 hypothetical protein EU513_14265 [Yimella sp. RIT 621]